MARIPRVAVEGIPYHVTQRGNGRQRLFHVSEDFVLYCRLLHERSEDYGLTLWAYCLMPNHVHLICVPRRPESMSRALGRTHADFARYFNLVRQSCGHVWEARYYSCPLDMPHLWRAMAYVERNPVRAGLAGEAWGYPWSSAAVHCGAGGDPLVASSAVWAAEYGPSQWREVLRSSIADEGMARRIREATRSGRPLGSEGFVEELELVAGRRLRVGRPGRPKAVIEEQAAAQGG